MTSYEILKWAEEQGAHTIEIQSLETGAEGVANRDGLGDVACFFGADDGSDDCVIPAARFDECFKVTAILFGPAIL